MQIKSPKKLIEVALPLDDINAAAAREKSIRHGHPSTLHLWWARRPLAACRAVIFASLVDDAVAQGIVGVQGLDGSEASELAAAITPSMATLITRKIPMATRSPPSRRNPGGWP